MRRLVQCAYGLALVCTCAIAQTPEMTVVWSGGAVEVVAPLKLTVRDVKLLHVALGDIEAWAYPGLNVEHGRLVGGLGLFKRVGAGGAGAIYVGASLRFDPERRPAVVPTLAASWRW